MPASSRSRICTGPHEWIWAAPGCLPKPTTAILVTPLSIGPLKHVCGLTRLTGRMRSAPAAWRSRCSVMPSGVVATTSVAIVARTSAPTRLLGDPEVGEHRPLALGGGPAVAAHRRHDERLRAELAQPVDRAAHQRARGRSGRGCRRRRRRSSRRDLAGRARRDGVVGAPGLDVGHRLGGRDRQLDLVELGTVIDGSNGSSTPAQLVPSHRRASVRRGQRCF